MKLCKRLLPFINNRNVVIVCIGTDIVGGDCLGPLVGQLLVERNVPAVVYGTLQSPVSALNVDEVNRFIRLNHPLSTVLAIDACVGLKGDEGKISISKGSIYPGAADGKNLMAIGDVSLTAVTSSNKVNEQEFMLVRLGFVYALAKEIADIIQNSLLQSIYYNKKEVFAIESAL